MKELTFHRWFLPWVERWPDAVGYTDPAGSSTYGEHTERVFRLASALDTELGVAPSDRVAVMGLNSRLFMELYHAAFLGGCVTNPLNLRFAPAELEYVLRDSGTRVVFVDAMFAGVIDQVRTAAGVDKVVLMGDAGDDTPFDLRYEDLLASGEPVEPHEPEESDPCLLMYTGGTTGMPKGVLCSQRAEMLNAWHIKFAIPMDHTQTLLCHLPMFHAACMGYVLNPQQGPAPTHILPMFDPKLSTDTIAKHGVTSVTAVPTMLNMMFNHPEFEEKKLASLEYLIYGASPMPVALLERLLEMYPELKFIQCYGMTEASVLLTSLTPEDHRRGGDRLLSAGRPVPGVRLRIEDEGGQVLPAGEVGEICAQGGNFMDGYWNKPEATEEAFRGDWYHSGDAGYLDDEGYLYIVDRVKDMIVSGGENVYSAEVENAIATHPAVLQVAVIGIPSEKWGEAVHAIVVLRPDATATDEELIAHAKTAIAGYKVPKSIEFRDELPLSGAGKVLKRDLKKPYWEGHGRGVG